MERRQHQLDNTVAMVTDDVTFYLRPIKDKSFMQLL